MFNINVGPGSLGIVVTVPEISSTGYDLPFHSILSHLPADGEFRLTGGSIQVELAVEREK
jgi:hypothetical protein